MQNSHVHDRRLFVGYFTFLRHHLLNSVIRKLCPPQSRSCRHLITGTYSSIKPLPMNVTRFLSILSRGKHQIDDIDQSAAAIDDDGGYVYYPEMQQTLFHPSTFLFTLQLPWCADHT